MAMMEPGMFLSQPGREMLASYHCVGCGRLITVGCGRLVVGE
jgi:hypothetical protein